MKKDWSNPNCVLVTLSAGSVISTSGEKPFQSAVGIVIADYVTGDGDVTGDEFPEPQEKQQNSLEH